MTKSSTSSICAYQYAIDASGGLSIERSGCIGMEDALVKAGASAMSSFSPEYVRETFACTP